MAENKTGAFSAISIPPVYNAVQFLAGARMYRDAMTRDFIKPFPGCKIIDIGCGTGEYVSHISKRCADFHYVGFDAETAYVAHARRRFEALPNVRFYRRELTPGDQQDAADADIVIATGVMHHLDDRLVLSLLQSAKKLLRPGGRLVTYDPGKYDDRMSLFERFFIRFDRGRNIRSEREYARLVAQVFPAYTSYVRCLTYYKSRNIVFECFNTTSPGGWNTSGCATS